MPEWNGDTALTYVKYTIPISSYISPQKFHDKYDKSMKFEYLLNIGKFYHNTSSCISITNESHPRLFLLSEIKPG